MAVSACCEWATRAGRVINCARKTDSTHLRVCLDYVSRQVSSPLDRIEDCRLQRGHKDGDVVTRRLTTMLFKRRPVSLVSEAEMKTLKLRLFLLVIALTVCCQSSSGQQSSRNLNVPRGWKKVNAEGLFTFYLPGSAWDTGLSGTDDFYREWRIGRMRFMFVYEPMSVLSYDSREKVFGTGFRESLIEVSGRKAYLFDYSLIEKGRREYYTDLFVGDLPKAQVKLWMQADSARPADLETARKIFRTVEFLQP